VTEQGLHTIRDYFSVKPLNREYFFR